MAIGTIYPNAGSHSYTAYYYASKLFENAQSNQINVYVNDKIHTKLTLTSNTTNNVNLNDKIKFTVKLVDGNNSPIANESVILYNDESIWTNLITDENGSADFDIKLVWNFESGDDALDTKWGEMAYEYNKNHPSSSSIYVEVDVSATQHEV